MRLDQQKRIEVQIDARCPAILRESVEVHPLVSRLAFLSGVLSYPEALCAFDGELTEDERRYALRAATARCKFERMLNSPPFHAYCRCVTVYPVRL